MAKRLGLRKYRSPCENPAKFAAKFGNAKFGCAKFAPKFHKGCKISYDFPFELCTPASEY